MTKCIRRAQFLTELREILGTPEWMLTVDNRKTKVLHDGACVQLLFHFKGNKKKKTCRMIFDRPRHASYFLL